MSTKLTNVKWETRNGVTYIDGDVNAKTGKQVAKLIDEYIKAHNVPADTIGEYWREALECFVSNPGENDTFYGLQIEWSDYGPSYFFYRSYLPEKLNTEGNIK